MGTGDFEWYASREDKPSHGPPVSVQATTLIPSTIPYIIHHRPTGAGTHEALLKRATRLVLGLPHGNQAATDLDPTLIQFGILLIHIHYHHHPFMGWLSKEYSRPLTLTLLLTLLLPALHSGPS